MSWWHKLRCRWLMLAAGLDSCSWLGCLLLLPLLPHSLLVLLVVGLFVLLPVPLKSGLILRIAHVLPLKFMDWTGVRTRISDRYLFHHFVRTLPLKVFKLYKKETKDRTSPEEKANTEQGLIDLPRALNRDLGSFFGTLNFTAAGRFAFAFGIWNFESFWK